MDHTPKPLQKRSIGSAFVLGYAGNYLLVDLIQGSSKLFMPNEFNSVYLPFLEKACIVLAIAAPVFYSFIKTNEMENLIKEHPTYTSGIIGAGLGAIHSTLENLI